MSAGMQFVCAQRSHPFLHLCYIPSFLPSTFQLCDFQTNPNEIKHLDSHLSVVSLCICGLLFMAVVIKYK